MTLVAFTARLGRWDVGRTRVVPRAYVALVLGCFALAWGVSLAWWSLLPGPRTVMLEIPAGTATAIARGETVTVIPATLALRRGDTLAVRNEDASAHFLGTVVIPPGASVRIPVTGSLLDSDSLLCSIHPAGALGIAPLARPGIAATLVPTLLAGLPLALASTVALFVMRRLSE